MEHLCRYHEHDCIALVLNFTRHYKAFRFVGTQERITLKHIDLHRPERRFPSKSPPHR